MRTTSQVTNRSFPFARQDVAFLLVVPGPRGQSETKDERGFEHSSTHDGKFKLIQRAQDLEAAEVDFSLLAIWPGKTRSDVFLVDDLAMALGSMGSTPAA